MKNIIINVGTPFRLSPPLKWGLARCSFEKRDCGSPILRGRCLCEGVQHVAKMFLLVIQKSYLRALQLLFWGSLMSFLPAQNLEDFLQEAYENNPQLEAAYLNYRAATEKINYTGVLPNPSVSMGAFVSPVETRVGPQLAKASVSQMLPWFGTKKALQQVVHSESEINFQQYLLLRNQLTKAVKLSWFELYRIQALSKILQEQIKVFHILEQLSLTRVTAGKAATTDVLRTQMQRISLENELANLQASFNPVKARFNQLIGREVNSPLGIPEDLPKWNEYANKEAMLDSLRSNHPALTLWDARKKLVQSNEQMIELKGKPQFGVGLDYAYIHPRPDQDIQGNGRDILMPMVSLSLPINRKQYASQLQEQQLKREALFAGQSHELSTLEAAFESALEDWERAGRNYALHMELVSRAKEVQELLTTDYSTTGSRYDQLLMVQNEVLQHEKQLVESTVKRAIAWARLEELQGK